MKRIPILLLTVAVLAALAACGRARPTGGEPASAETTTTTQTTARPAVTTLFAFPALPTTVGEYTYFVDVPVQAPPAAKTTARSAATVTGTVLTQLTTTTAVPTTTTKPVTTTTATTTRTTTTPATTTRAPTTAATTTRPTTTTTFNDTTGVTTTTVPKPTKGTFEVSVAKAKAINKENSATAKITNSIGEESTRIYTGVRLKDFLAAQGVDIVSGATVTATSSDGKSVTLGYSEIISNSTLLAWDETGTPLGQPRLCPCASTGENAHLFLKDVVSVELK